MTARREIGKWINEQPNCEVDRKALAELIVEYDDLRDLIGDIKAWDVANYMALPYDLRVRIQAFLVVPNSKVSGE